jgi:hypothetical protein
MTNLQFCALHKIAYNSDLDPTCPQCTLARLQGAIQYDYDAGHQQPIEPQSGKLLDRKTLQPVG